MGKQIGEHFKNEILGSRMAISPLLDAINGIVAADKATFYDPFADAAQTHFPDYVEEITGMADGCGLSVQDMMLNNMFLDVLYYYMGMGGEMTVPRSMTMRCSSVMYAQDGKVIQGKARRQG